MTIVQAQLSRYEITVNIPYNEQCGIFNRDIHYSIWDCSFSERIQK
jgi:hypothetical protein